MKPYLFLNLDGIFGKTTHLDDKNGVFLHVVEKNPKIESMLEKARNEMVGIGACGRSSVSVLTTTSRRYAESFLKSINVEMPIYAREDFLVAKVTNGSEQFELAEHKVAPNSLLVECYSVRSERISVIEAKKAHLGIQNENVIYLPPYIGGAYKEGEDIFNAEIEKRISNIKYPEYQKSHTMKISLDDRKNKNRHNSIGKSI